MRNIVSAIEAAHYQDVKSCEILQNYALPVTAVKTPSTLLTLDNKPWNLPRRYKVAHIRMIVSVGLPSISTKGTMPPALCQ
jgi:hypothetical protein